MSSIGVNSPSSVRAAASAVAAVQRDPTSVASVATARFGVAATPPQPIRADTTLSPSSTSANATNTAEMSWSRRFDSLYARSARPPARRGTRTDATNSPGTRAVFW